MNPVTIIDVSARDGLQNEPVTIATADKVELVDRMVAAGARRVEVTSFVHPHAVPQLADAEEVTARLRLPGGVAAHCLVLNQRGYDRAVAAGYREVNTVVLASDTFGRRNQNTTTAEALAFAADLAVQCRADGVRLTVTVGAAFGCPFEGEVDRTRLAQVVAGVLAVAPDEVSLADTIGVATPADVRYGARLVVEAGVPLRLHLHDTRNTAVANAVAGVEAGASALDATVAGIGGCPFAPNATGNVATEDLVYTLGRMGYDLGYDLGQVLETSRWVSALLGREPTSGLARAGGFPATIPTGGR